MILSPYSLLDSIKKGKILTNLDERELNSPEGVGFDLRIGALFKIDDSAGYLGVTTRKTPDSQEIPPNKDNSWILEPGGVYLATTLEEFDLPPELAAIFFPRSTLFRSGITFNSGILPPGYKGTMTFALINNHVPFKIEKEARFAHVVFHLVTGDVGLYKGQWQHGRVSQPNAEWQV